MWIAVVFTWVRSLDLVIPASLQIQVCIVYNGLVFGHDVITHHIVASTSSLEDALMLQGAATLEATADQRTWVRLLSGGLLQLLAAVQGLANTFSNLCLFSNHHTSISFSTAAPALLMSVRHCTSS